ncbi:MAG: glycosyltransferase family 4 protein [Acidobacteria bacterium]|nr:glycosyltransferase family 4 protein [Acidobacteriota bacterium]
MPLRIVIDVRHIRDFGIGSYIRNLVHGLGLVDAENQYVLTARRGEVHEFAHLPKNFQTVPYDRSDTDLLDQIAYPWFLRTLAGDLYHVPLNRVSWMMPKPYIVTVHDMSGLLYQGRVTGWRNNLRLFLFRRGLLRADRIIAVSGATRRDVENVLGIPGSRIRQIYSAPDPRFEQRQPAADARAAGPDTQAFERRRILERYRIHDPFLLYTGMIRPQKNIPRLIEAFASVRTHLSEHPRYKDLKLIVIGDETSRFPGVRRAVNQYRVEGAVRFLGFVPFDTLRVFYEAAEAFVFPSLYEGFGLPPLEAMASGTPVVTSNVSSLPEVVGDAAMTVNPENVFDIARGIREVLLDDDLRDQLRRKGFERIRLFSWRRTAEAVLETYREVAAAAHRLPAGPGS